MTVCVSVEAIQRGDVTRLLEQPSLNSGDMFSLDYTKKGRFLAKLHTSR